MPETIDAPPEPEVTPDEAELSMSTFDKHVAAPPAPETPPTPEPANPASEAPKHDAAAGDIPPELLGEAKPPEAKPDTREELKKLLTETPSGQIKHEHFKKVQQGAAAEVERVTAELAQARAELEKRTAAGVPAEVEAELKTLREKAAANEAELERIAYERSPKFKREFGSRIEQQAKLIEQAGKEYGVSEEDIAAISALNGKQRSQRIGELDIDDVAKADIASLLRQRDMLHYEAEAAKGKSREELAAHLKEQEAAKQEEAKRQQAEEDRIFTDALSEAKTKLAGFRAIEGNEAWNREVSEREERAKNLFNGKGTMRELAELAHLGLDHPVQVRIIKSQQTKIAQMTEELGKLRAANPGAGVPTQTKPDGTALSEEERARMTFDKHVGGQR